MSNLEQRVKTLELMHEINVPITREDVWGPMIINHEKIVGLTDALLHFNGREGLPYIERTHLRKLAKEARKFLEEADDGIPKYSHKVCEDLIETRKKLEKAEATICKRECEIASLVNQVNELAGSQSSQLTNSRAEAERLRDLLRESQAELNELTEWKKGKKGIEDYYKVQEENRKLREHFRYLGLDVPNV